MTNKIPHDIRGGSIRELADMYKDELAFVREHGLNILDQLQHPNAKGKRDSYEDICP